MFFSIIGSGLCTSLVNLILCFSAVLGEANADSRWLWHLFWMWQQPTYLLGNHQCCCWQGVRRVNCPTTPLVYREVDKQLSGSKRASEATQNSWGNLTWELPRKKNPKRSSCGWFSRQTWDNNLWHYSVVPTRNNGEKTFSKAKQGQCISMQPGTWIWKTAISSWSSNTEMIHLYSCSLIQSYSLEGSSSKQ